MRAVMIFVVVALVATIVAVNASYWWAAFALDGRTFSGFSTFGFWWSPLHLLDLLDELVVLFVAGLVLVVTATIHRPLIWGFSLGVTVAALRSLLSSDWISPAAELNDYFWIYSDQLVSPLASLLGSFAGAKWRLLIRGSVVA